MLVFNYSPSPQSWEFNDLYIRSAREGMVHSAMMCGEHFDMVDDYSDEYAADAVTWSCGGRENYQLSSRKVISIEPAGVFTIAAGERYAYDASRDAPFRSNMIIFPQWMAHDVTASSEFCDDASPLSRLTTRLCHPGKETIALMNNIAGHCILTAEDTTWYTEQVTLLYARLLQEQAAGGVETSEPPSFQQAGSWRAVSIAPGNWCWKPIAIPIYQLMIWRTLRAFRVFTSSGYSKTRKASRQCSTLIAFAWKQACGFYVKAD